YTIETKLKVIMDHGYKSGLFTIKGLLTHREKNYLNYKIYKQYSHLFKFTIKYPKFIILLIALFPRFILSIIKKYIKHIKEKGA
ncbi:MAG: glycosyltransferase family 2 protein, partial [Thermoplasmata archaeon]